MEISIELTPYEYKSLIENEMIGSMCGDQLASPGKRGKYIVLRLADGKLEELIGFVAAEANHAKTREEEDVFGDLCDNMEGVLSRIRMEGN